MEGDRSGVEVEIVRNDVSSRAIVRFSNFEML